MNSKESPSRTISEETEFERTSPNDDDASWRRSWRDKIGGWGILILGVGTFTLLLAIGMLAFLWDGALRAASGSGQTVSWKHIALTGWTTRWVTICSVGIRAAIAAHLGLVTAMVASLVLETSGTSLANAPLLAIARTTNPAPYNIWLAAVNRPHGFRGKGYVAVLSLAVAVLAVSQFTSTILLSDFNNINIAGENTTSTVAITKISSVLGQETRIPFGYDSRRSSPAAHWRFAETRRPALMGPDFDETGEVYRAFLPFLDQTERTTLMAYAGLAPVVNSRVVCSQPTLSNLNVSYDPLTRQLQVQGKVELNDSFPVQRKYLRRSNDSVDFWCLLPWGTETTGQSGLDWPLTLCRTSLFITLGSDSLQNTAKSAGLLVFNSTREPVAMAGSAFPPQGAKFVSNPGGAWTSISLSTARALFSATVCYGSPFETKIYTTSMVSSRGAAEPRFGWMAGTRRYATAAVRSQLDTLDASPDLAARGVLDLQIFPDGPRRTSEYLPYDILTILRMSAPEQLLDPLNTLVMTSTVGPDARGVTNEPLQIHSAVFQDSLKATGSPARALQALLFRFAQMTYYEWSHMHDDLVPVSTVHTTGVLVPVRLTGLLGVLAVIALHLGLVGLITALFLTRTEFSLLGDAWATVAQMTTGDAAALLEDADGTRNKDTQEIRGEKEAHGLRVGISRSWTTGRSELGPFAGGDVARQDSFDRSKSKSKV